MPQYPQLGSPQRSMKSIEFKGKSTHALLLFSNQLTLVAIEFNFAYKERKSAPPMRENNESQLTLADHVIKARQMPNF